MTETIRYNKIGQEDVNFGKDATFEVKMPNGSVVVLTMVDVGEILNDADLSTQALTIVSMLTTSFIRYQDSNSQVLHAFGSSS